MKRLVEIVQSWNGQVGILGCHEPVMGNDEIQFRIYPVSYYNPKKGNRRNNNATDNATEQVNSLFLNLAMLSLFFRLNIAQCQNVRQ